MSFQLSTSIASWNEGDRISLPYSILETLHSKLNEPVPTTKNNYLSSNLKENDSNPFFFELETLDHKHKIACGVKDFSAPEGQVYVPAWILSTLELSQKVNEIIFVQLIHLPKAKTITLKAKDMYSLSLENPRAVLEAYLRTHFSSLTQGVTLPVSTFQPQLYQSITCQYYVDDIQPSSPASLINVDVEVQIVPLEEDPRMLLKRKEEYDALVKSRMPIFLPMNELTTLSLEPSNSIYFSLPLNKKLSMLSVQAEIEEGDISIFLHPFLLPNINDNIGFSVHTTNGILHLIHDFKGNDYPFLQMLLGIHSYGEKKSKFKLNWSDHSTSSIQDLKKAVSFGEGDKGPSSNEEYCKNCNNWVPKASYTLHEVRCIRDNIKCLICQQSYPSTKVHWHCDDCDFIGTLPTDPSKHTLLYHTSYACSGCHTLFPCAAGSMYQHHRSKECPYRRIYCRFCQTYPISEGPSSTASDRLSGIETEHESKCASRTLDCQICFKPVPMKQLSVHMRLHQTTPSPAYLVCNNQVCGNEMDIKNGFGLCATCFRPFIQTSSEAALKKKVHRYFHQMTNGCGHTWCQNKYCKSSSLFSNQGLDATACALLCLELAKETKSWYCVSSHRLQLRRELANELVNFCSMPLGTCLKALMKYEEQIWFGSDEDEEEKIQEEHDIEELKTQWVSLAANYLQDQKQIFE